MYEYGFTEPSLRNWQTSMRPALGTGAMSLLACPLEYVTHQPIDILKQSQFDLSVRYRAPAEGDTSNALLVLVSGFRTFYEYGAARTALHRLSPGHPRAGSDRMYARTRLLIFIRCYNHERHASSSASISAPRLCVAPGPSCDRQHLKQASVVDLRCLSHLVCHRARGVIRWDGPLSKRSEAADPGTDLARFRVLCGQSQESLQPPPAAKT